ncbi:MAG: aminopeptidase P family N-terminal domain-containing protein [Acidimicrobiales bacterium]
MTSLLRSRRDRVLAAMADAELDVLVLGRQDDANFASGMHRLWTAGTRPFGAGCIVVRSTGRTHVLSSWDAGLPPTMSRDDLFPASWNPRIMAGHMATVPGLADARRIGVDEMSPSFGRAVARLAPDAVVVPADVVIAAARRLKSPDELDRIRAACVVAWRGVEAALRQSASPDPTLGLAEAIEAMAAEGVTTPSSAPVIRRSPEGSTIDLGVMLDGYEGGVGGCFVDGRRVGADDLAMACRPGATHADLVAAAADDWFVRGLGMGYEKPVITPTLGVGEVLEDGMVLSVRDGDRRDVVAVTATGPVVLSQRPHSEERST